MKAASAMETMPRFDLSPAECEGFEAVRRIAQAHRPAAGEALPRAALRTLFGALAPTGYLASTLARSEGGHGLSPLAFGVLVESLAPELTLLGNHSVQRYLADFGSASLKERHLPSLLDGSGIGAIAITEAHAGSDLAAMQTRVRRSGRVHRLSGRKTWVTHGMFATLFVVLARSGDDGSGFTRFIVPAETPGLSVRPLNPIGLRHLSFAEVTFDDCELGDESRLGDEGRGSEGTKTAFPLARALAALQSLRIAEAALDAAHAYAAERQILGTPLSRRELVQDGHVRLATGADALRLLAYRVLSDLSRPEALRSASAVKAAAADLSLDACRWSGEVMGSQALDEDAPINALTCDARMMSVVDGTSVLNRLVVARRTVGAPRPAPNPSA